MENRITRLFGIKYPIVQAGMIWASGWELASAVSNSGGLGLLGAGSMYPDILRDHIRKCRLATSKPFGVNVPLLYPDIDKHMEIIVSEKVPIVFTSAGNPSIWTKKLMDEGITVVHVVSSSKFAMKAEQAGCQAVVAEGFEAGGHNGREETTTMCLIPGVVESVKIPVIAAGGIASGRAVLAAFALGAEGVQVGSRFVATEEASCHIAFKERVINSNEGDTILTLKELTPVRMMKNKFYLDVAHAYEKGATREELTQLLGRARAKKGMFEGDMEEGELEIGQCSANITGILTAGEVMNELVSEYRSALEELIKTRSNWE